MRQKIDSKYRVDPQVEYLTETVEGIETHLIDRLAEQTWNNFDEGLYIGKVPKQLLTFNDDSEITGLADNYFHKKKYKENINDLPAIDLQYDNDMELFCKFVWLYNEHRTKGFVNPIGVHLNPRTEQFVIHPGGCRNKVLKYFHEGPIYAVLFNTKGYQASWMKALNRVTIDQVRDKHPCIIGWVADHGTLIPHFLIQVETIAGGIETWHKKIQKRLKRLRISTDMDMRWTNDWKHTSDTNVTIVQYKQEVPKVNEFKGLVAMLSGVDYEDIYWRIECN